MALSITSLLLTLYISCETIRANYAYYAFHTFPQISASIIALLSEILKLSIAAFFIIRKNNGVSIATLTRFLGSAQKGDIDFKKTMKYALPAALYMTNNLIYYTVLPLTSPSLLQVCVLAKLPTTGILHHYMLKPQRNLYAWVSLFCLCVGLGIFNIPSSKNPAPDSGAWWLAPLAGFVIACLSALASISTETSTKEGEFWESQAYLYIWGMLFAMIAYPLAPSGGNKSGAESAWSFDMWMAVLGLVVITSGTGLVVAVVLRARDNILKVIGTAASLITIATSQFILLPELRASTFTPWKVCGGGVVTMSTWCYHYYSQQPWQQSGFKTVPSREPEDTESGEEEQEPQIGEKSDEGSPFFRPNPTKITVCGILILFATIEVSLHTR